ncbi:MAG TPA: Crp/Fnr family transcriptional regulator [Dermatophilaceae bacterium]
MKWALFDGLAVEQTRAVLGLARRRKFSRGEVVFHEGDPGDTLHLIDRGHVAVRVTTPLGDMATLRIIGPGEYFGELALVSPAPRSATITALEPTETLVLHRDQINRVRLEHPDVEQALLDLVVGEVRRLSAALLDAMYAPVPLRLARQLVGLARSYQADAQGRVVIPLTQDDLASLCGTTRPTINQLIGKLTDNKLLEVARGRVIVTDLPGLARKAR